MGLFYQDGVLHFGEATRVNLLDIARKTDKPFYVYDLEGIRLRVRALQAAYPGIQIHYAMKANGASAILNLFKEEGTGVDVVSGGEIKIALDHGFLPDKIIFSGVGKTKAELQLAIDKKIHQINVESPQELARIIELAKESKAHPNVAFRMNPDVDAQTHPYITTGFRENKFGMGEYFLKDLLALLQNAQNQVNLCGLTLHIGSQLLNIAPIEEAIRKTMPIWEQLKNLGFAMKTFDAGGGLGIPYREPHAYPARDLQLIEDYGKMLKSAFGSFSGKVLCEPGRILVGSCGVLVGEVQYLKETPYRNFIILNTGIHHLIRPALYQAHHNILPLREAKTGAPVKTYDVVGPICESSDVLGKDRELSHVQAGDFLAIADAGAYGYTMASHYNEHAFPEQFTWENGKLTPAV